MAISFAVGPIAQDVAYHNFADDRTILGIANFANVTSNIPFLAIGLLGLGFVSSARRTGAWQAWAVLFAGIALVSLGSAYYHLAPGDARLVWDRLPMTIAFMGLLCVLLEEDVKPGLGRRILLPALLLGVISVVWWRITGDLRFYIWVQAVPFVTVVAAGLLFPAGFTHRMYLVYGLGCYVLAKIAELYDDQLFRVTVHFVSGHTVKHLLASLGAVFVYLMLRKRKAIDIART